MTNEISERAGFLTSHAVDDAIAHSLQMPQAKVDVSHFFGPGIYIREARVSAGVFAIGQIHKTACTNVFIKGRVLVLTDDAQTKELVAPMTFVSPPGRNVGYILEDMIWQNVYATEETDIAKLEALFLDMNDPLILKNMETKAGIDRSEDVADYLAILDERGMTETAVRAIVENDSDMMRLPYGTYKITVSNSNIQGRGVFAVSDIGEGEVIAPVRIGERRTPVGRYTNHSKTPNAFPRLNGSGGIDLVAQRQILGSRGGLDGEEITVDYRQAQAEAIKLDKELECLHSSQRM